MSRMNDSWSAHIERVLPEVVTIRHDLHAHPELSFAEHNTSNRIRKALAKLPNLKVLPAFAQTDVVAVLNGDRPGSCLALRADIDALPIEEQTNVEYKLTVPGASLRRPERWTSVDGQEKRKKSSMGYRGYLMRMDYIVPVPVETVRPQADLCHLFVRDHQALGITQNNDCGGHSLRNKVAYSNSD